MYTLSIQRWVGGRSSKVPRRVALDKNGHSSTLHTNPPTHRHTARLCISHRCAPFITRLASRRRSGGSATEDVQSSTAVRTMMGTCFLYECPLNLRPLNGPSSKCPSSCNGSRRPFRSRASQRGRAQNPLHVRIFKRGSKLPCKCKGAPEWPRAGQHPCFPASNWPRRLKHTRHESALTQRTQKKKTLCASLRTLWVRQAGASSTRPSLRGTTNACLKHSHHKRQRYSYPQHKRLLRNSNETEKGLVQPVSTSRRLKHFRDESRKLALRVVFSPRVCLKHTNTGEARCWLSVNSCIECRLCGPDAVSEQHVDSHRV